MCYRGKIRKILREHYGAFETVLEHQYEDKITNQLHEGPYSNREAWATYNQVVLELKNSLNDTLRVKELQYKLTDECNPKDIVIEVIESVKTITPELERLYNKIKNFN
jgi:hypothetical protein